jgi:hypothetical protein
MRSYLEKTKHKNRTVGVTQVVEHLCSKHEALSSRPSTSKNKKKNEKREDIWYESIYVKRTSGTLLMVWG